MHIARQTQHQLVIVAGSRWVSAICAAAALFTFYSVVTRHQPKGLFLLAFFLLFALVMDLRKTFTFDAVERIVRWRGRKVFKAESGEIPFDEITDIGTEASIGGNRGTLNYRLTIVTPRAVIPMAYAYSGQPDHYAALRCQILAFVRPGSAAESSEPAG
jgi:hypothetical protein